GGLLRLAPVRRGGFGHRSAPVVLARLPVQPRGGGSPASGAEAPRRPSRCFRSAEFLSGSAMSPIPWELRRDQEGMPVAGVAGGRGRRKKKGCGETIARREACQAAQESSPEKTACPFRL